MAKNKKGYQISKNPWFGFIIKGVVFFILGALLRDLTLSWAANGVTSQYTISALPMIVFWMIGLWVCWRHWNEIKTKNVVTLYKIEEDLFGYNEVKFPRQDF